MRANGKKRTLVVAIFSHIEVYPPSLNALYHLAPLFDEVYIIVRNVWISDWSYPGNVEVITSGKFVPLQKVGENSVAEKLKAYYAFGITLARTCREKNPSVVLLYDAAAFSLYHVFCRKTQNISKPLVWYHNHDVSVEGEVGRLSLMRLMKKLETRYFRRAGMFSLPNQVRLQYFATSELTSRPFIIPNYPSRFFFGKWKRESRLDNDNIKLIFQGHISPSNRITQFIEVLPACIGGRRLELHLAGPISASYEATLRARAAELAVSDQLFFYGRLSYAQLPALTAACHIGLAIYGFHNTMVRTMSTASNKIFEYASVGLPVIVNDRSDLRDEFGIYPWIHFVGDDINSIRKVLEAVVANYESYSLSARRDFELSLNFETVFEPVKMELERKFEVSGW